MPRKTRRKYSGWLYVLTISAIENVLIMLWCPA
jgi:hypothetical protein